MQGTANTTEPAESLVSRIKREGRKLQRATEESYRALITSACDGRAVDPAAVALALRELGKAPEHFQADVDLLKRRRAQRAIVDQQSEKSELKNTVQTAMSIEVARFKPLHDAHIQKMRELNWELQQVNDLIVQAGSAARELEATSPAGLREERAAHYQLLNGLRGKLNKLREDLEENSGNAKYYRQIATGVRHASTEFQKQDALQAADRLDVTVAAIHATIPALEMEIAAAEAKDAEFVAKMMEP